MFDFFEFFAGGGMVRAGLGAKWRCRFANDFDPKKSAVYRRNWATEFSRRPMSTPSRPRICPETSISHGLLSPAKTFRSPAEAPD
jgi:site-specific DNA-cytosine methylase